jgi:hypothetical protein
MSAPVSPGLVNELQVLQGPGAINGLALYNASGADDYFILIFDSAAEPVAEDVPHWAPIPLAASTYYESTLRREFKAGCWIMVSTDATTLIQAAGVDVFVSASVA